MRFKQYLQEAYLKRINVGKESYEIFKNSSKIELFKLFDAGVPYSETKPIFVSTSIKDFLNEEYCFLCKQYYWRGKDKTYEVYVNPSSKEITSSKDAGEVRFCIDLKKKDLYVWHPELLHEEMAKQAEKEGVLEPNSYSYKDAVRNPYVWGVAELVYGKLEITEQSLSKGSNVDFDLVGKKRDKHGKDVSWLKHWFAPDTYEDLSE